MIQHICSILFTFCASAIAQESAIDVNFGFTVSKSVLGVSYIRDGNELNLGLKRADWSLDEGASGLLPGITYIRDVANSGFFMSTGLIPRNQTRGYFVVNTDSTNGAPPYSIQESTKWITPLFTIGVGKTFQWPDWGLHLDANLGWAIPSRSIRDYNYTLGIGISQRFQLD